MELAPELVENIVGKEENVKSLQSFQNVSFTGALKLWIVWLRVNSLPQYEALDLSIFKVYVDDDFGSKGNGEL